MKKVLALIMALSVSLIGGCGNSNDEGNIDAKHISEMMIEYNAEKKILERELGEKRAAYESVLGGNKCCFVLYLDNIESNLMDMVYPVMVDYGFAATAIMSDLHIPTEEGYISKADYDKLVGAGWDFAIGTGSLDLSGDDKVQVFKSYIASYRELLNNAGINMPQTIYFHPGDYSEELTDAIIEEGFTVACCRDGMKDTKARALGMNGLFMMETGYVNGNSSADLRGIMQTAHEQKLAYAVSARYIVESLTLENKSLDCTQIKYIDMIDFIIEECPEALVMTSKTLYDYKLSALWQEYFLHQEELEAIEEKQLRLYEVTAELDKIDKMIKERLK